MNSTRPLSPTLLSVEVQSEEPHITSPRPVVRERPECRSSVTPKSLSEGDQIRHVLAFLEPGKCHIGFWFLSLCDSKSHSIQLPMNASMYTLMATAGAAEE